jgi:hypothetical protein
MTKTEAKKSALTCAYCTVLEVLQCGWPGDGFKTEDERMMMQDALTAIVEDLRRKAEKL